MSLKNQIGRVGETSVLRRAARLVLCAGLATSLAGALSLGSAAAASAAPQADAPKLIFGYACGLDMTRRDLQLVAREKGRPWDLGKDVDESVGESKFLIR